MNKDQFNNLDFNQIGRNVEEFVEAVRSNEPIYKPETNETYLEVFAKIYGYSIKFNFRYRYSRLFLCTADKYWIRTLETGNYCDPINGFFQYLGLYDEIVFGKRDGNFNVIKNEITKVANPQSNDQLLETFAGLAMQALITSRPQRRDRGEFKEVADLALSYAMDMCDVLRSVERLNKFK